MVGMAILAVPERPAVFAQANTQKEENVQTAGVSGAFVNFNFDQVEIRFLVKLVGDLTGKRFVIDKEIDGKVTVVTPPQIPLAKCIPFLFPSWRPRAVPLWSARALAGSWYATSAQLPLRRSWAKASRCPPTA